MANNQNVEIIRQLRQEIFSWWATLRLRFLGQHSNMTDVLRANQNISSADLFSLIIRAAEPLKVEARSHEGIEPASPNFGFEFRKDGTLIGYGNVSNYSSDGSNTVLFSITPL